MPVAELKANLLAAKVKKPKSGSRWCSVGSALEVVGAEDPDTAALLKTLAEDKRIPVERIEFSVRDAGYPISRNAIKRHRARTCPCHDKK
jgi:hypothetical protein